MEENYHNGLHKLVWEDLMNGPRKFTYTYGILEDDTCFLFKNIIDPKLLNKTNVLFIGILKGIQDKGQM